jgi:hypothetical protein
VLHAHKGKREGIPFRHWMDRLILPKNKLLCYLLWFFLGFLGAHRFMLGSGSLAITGGGFRAVSSESYDEFIAFYLQLERDLFSMLGKW